MDGFFSRIGYRPRGRHETGVPFPGLPDPDLPRWYLLLDKGVVYVGQQPCAGQPWNTLPPEGAPGAPRRVLLTSTSRPLLDGPAALVTDMQANLSDLFTLHSSDHGPTQPVRIGSALRALLGDPAEQD